MRALISKWLIRAIDRLHSLIRGDFLISLLDFGPMEDQRMPIQGANHAKHADLCM